MKKKHYKVVMPDGTTCPRCGEEAETRTHTEITSKQLSQPFYYKYWYNCAKRDCKTTIFMLEDWKVWNKNASAQNFKLLQEDKENQERIKWL